MSKSAELNGIVEASAKRLAGSLAEASRRAQENLISTQKITAAMIAVLADASSAVATEATQTVNFGGQLAAEVCSLHDNVGRLRQVAADVDEALISVTLLEQLLADLEAP